MQIAPHRWSLKISSYISANLGVSWLTCSKKSTSMRHDSMEPRAKSKDDVKWAVCTRNGFISFAWCLIFHFTCHFSFSIFHFPFVPFYWNPQCPRPLPQPTPPSLAQLFIMQTSNSFKFYYSLCFVGAVVAPYLSPRSFTSASLLSHIPAHSEFNRIFSTSFFFFLFLYLSIPHFHYAR